MKNFFSLRQATRYGLLALIVGSSGITLAQSGDDSTVQERRQMMEQRRAEFLENNPEAAERMAQRRREREEFRANNPEAAEKMARQRHMQQEGKSGQGPGRGRYEGRPDGSSPEFRGRRGDGPPPGFGRGPEGRPGARPGFGPRSDHDPANEDDAG